MISRYPLSKLEACRSIKHVELKHLSKRGEKSTESPLVVASERGLDQLQYYITIRT